MSTYGVFGSRAAILGHRGCGRGVVDGYVENTLESFLAAVGFGLDWVEVDVRRTSDDVLVVTHNPARDDGAFYCDLTGEQAAASGALRLETLLEALPPHVGVDFDVKSDLADAQRDRLRTTTGLLAPIATREAARRPTLITSFDAGGLTIARELAPGVPRGLLTWVEFPAGHAVAAAAHLDVQVLALHGGSLKPNKIEPRHLQYPLPRIVETVHGAGLELMAWCPGVKFGRELLAAGADALCVNNVPKLLAELTVSAARAS
ncbi:MAG TPA: glycerophosphodiester phosphodiesterase [Kineosporiaceae bacterium]|nr:glycerophosphodiester phosphodiesterase [Kineosporiaceae bacterium]